MKPLHACVAAVFAVGVGLLGLSAAPIPKGAKELPPPTAAELKQSENNLKQIVLAMHNYHDTTGAMPNNSVDGDNKPLLSWRVKLLPYLEEGELYKQFKLDEAWDSADNKKLIGKMPKVFAPARVKPKDPGLTFYRGFTGEGAVFEAGLRLTLIGVTDGTSNTVAVVEADEPCTWTKPDDLPYAADKDLPKLGGLFDGDFHCALCDGVVRLVSKDFKPVAFKAAVTRAGGEVYDADEAFPKPKKAE